MDDFLLKHGIVNQEHNYSLVSIDSRDIVVGQMFFALEGNKFDGNQYINAAAAKGASVAVVSKPSPSCIIPQLVVKDVKKVLLEFAKQWRMTVSPICLGVTGSNGKTTTRSMIEHVMNKLDLSKCASSGNNNNDLGVALSLLKLRAHHSYAVFEMGASAIGEISKLVQSVQPEIGIFTNASECHLEGFGSLDGVVKAKSELFSSMSNGSAIINIDSYGSRYCLTESDHLNAVTFGKKQPSVDFGFDNVISLNGGGVRFTLIHDYDKTTVKLGVAGIHNVYNACATIAALVTAGLALPEIVAALADYQGEERRLKTKITSYGAFIIDDSYNASPASFDAALEKLSFHGAKNKWLICGDMAELGNKSALLHDKLMSKIKEHKFENLITYGSEMKSACKRIGLKAYHARSLADLEQQIMKKISSGDAVLIKGSRSMNLDKISDALMEK